MGQVLGHVLPAFLVTFRWATPPYARSVLQAAFPNQMEVPHVHHVPLELSNRPLAVRYAPIALLGLTARLKDHPFVLIANQGLPSRLPKLHAQHVRQVTTRANPELVPVLAVLRGIFRIVLAPRCARLVMLVDSLPAVPLLVPTVLSALNSLHLVRQIAHNASLATMLPLLEPEYVTPALLVTSNRNWEHPVANTVSLVDMLLRKRARCVFSALPDIFSLQWDSNDAFHVPQGVPQVLWDHRRVWIVCQDLRRPNPRPFLVIYACPVNIMTK